MAGQTASSSSITIRAGARVDGITLEVSKITPQTFTHGYGGVSGSMNMLQLNPGEYITSMETHRNKNRQTKEHARVFYLVRHERISGGSQTDSMGSTTAPASYQLAEFYGLDGGQVDVVGAIWPPLPTEVACSFSQYPRARNVSFVCGSYL
eukprot:jgi/Phyca11/119586/e_gw1.39.347.1